MSDDDLRRRRRLTSSGPRRTSGSGGGNSFGPWLITIAAAIAVIVGGWFLGQTLAHVFNGSGNSTQVARQEQPTAAPVVTPLPSASPEATIAPVAAASPTAAPTPERTEKPTPSPTAQPTEAPTLAPTEKPTATPAAAPTLAPSPSAARKTQPIARRSETTPAPAAAATASPAIDDASRTVRSYIDALRRGDPQAAAAYLGNGVPDESFIDGNTRIASINSTRNGDGSYKVEVDMKTAQGEYYETFVVASTPNGNRILEKTASQP